MSLSISENNTSGRMSNPILYPRPKMGAEDLTSYIYQRVPGSTGTGHRPFYHGQNGHVGHGHQAVPSVSTTKAGLRPDPYLIPTPEVPGYMVDQRAGVSHDHHERRHHEAKHHEPQRHHGPMDPYQPYRHQGLPTHGIISHINPNAGDLWPNYNGDSTPNGSDSTPNGSDSTPNGSSSSQPNMIFVPPPPPISRPDPHADRPAPAPISYVTPGEKLEKDYPDIPLPQSDGTKNPFLQAYEDGIETDQAEDFHAPTQLEGKPLWNPREHEMVNMQDWVWERQAFLKKLEDPRRRYLARYAWIRERMCSDRFRSPEYQRLVPGTCTPKTNPYNYALGPPNMLSSDALGDQEGIFPTPGAVSQFSPGSWGSTSSHGGFMGNTQPRQDAFGPPACQVGTSWHPGQGQCVESTMLGTAIGP